MEASTMSLDLRHVFGLCQGEHSDDWIRIPGGGPTNLFLSGLRDVSSTDEPPALEALHPQERAVYMPDARIALAWGIEEDDWQERRGHQPEPPEWMPQAWSGVRPCYAHILVNGAVVWQVRYGSVNWGAGISGIVPWPHPDYAARESVQDAPQVRSWDSTRWTAEFARLLNELDHNYDFRFDDELSATGMQLLDISPIGAEREGLVF